MNGCSVRYGWAFTKNKYIRPMLKKLKRLFQKSVPMQVTFIYNTKKSKDLRHTIYVNTHSDTTTHDLAKYFNPQGMDNATCTITKIAVAPIKFIEVD